LKIDPPEAEWKSLRSAIKTRAFKDTSRQAAGYPYKRRRWPRASSHQIEKETTIDP